MRETNEIIAKERGLNPGELPQTPEGSAYNPGMEYVTPEGARFPAGDVESGTPGMVFEEGGEGNRQMPPGYSLRELVQDNEEWYKTGDNGDIIITDNAYITAKDGGKHNGKYVNALKWKDKQVNKAYNSYVYQVELHHDKIAHPERYIEDWNQKPSKEQLGNLEKWRKDAMRNAQKASIMLGILRERGIIK